MIALRNLKHWLPEGPSGQPYAASHGPQTQSNEVSWKQRLPSD